MVCILVEILASHSSFSLDLSRKRLKIKFAKQLISLHCGISLESRIKKKRLRNTIYSRELKSSQTNQWSRADMGNLFQEMGCMKISSWSGELHNYKQFKVIFYWMDCKYFHYRRSYAWASALEMEKKIFSINIEVLVWYYYWYQCN